MTMQFLQPAALILIVLVPLAGAFLFWREGQRRLRVLQLGDAPLVEAISNFYPRRRLLKNGCWLAALGCLILALARPVWGEELSLIEEEGISAFIVLDVSASMSAQDIAPNRLSRAKLMAEDIAAQLAGDEVGLILFAGSAYVQFPLTTDTSSADSFINAASTQSVSNQGSAVEAALDLAINSFDSRRTANRIIILMTDGESHDDQPILAAQRAAEQNITIHAIGFGSTSGEPIPMIDANGAVTGFRLDEAGNPILTRLNEEILKSITETTGGIYQNASSGDINLILQEIAEVETDSLDSRVESKPVERFGIFVGLALAALSASFLIPETQANPR